MPTLRYPAIGFFFHERATGCVTKCAQWGDVAVLELTARNEMEFQSVYLPVLPPLIFLAPHQSLLAHKQG